MTKEFIDYIEDIIKAMNDALAFVENMNYSLFIKDTKTTYAVIRALEILGKQLKKCLLPSKPIIIKFLGKRWLECETKLFTSTLEST